VRVFPDTNVLASAFGTRGLCADLMGLVLQDHELITGEVIIGELRRVLKRKFGVPPASINEIEKLLRSYHVEPKPRDLPELKLRDRNDRLVVASAINGRAEVLVTGDLEMLDLEQKPPGLKILRVRDFWNLAAGKQ
jgi:putative PIN family toxin of toxin-antitoxin system